VLWGWDTCFLRKVRPFFYFSLKVEQILLKAEFARFCKSGQILHKAEFALKSGQILLLIAEFARFASQNVFPGRS